MHMQVRSNLFCSNFNMIWPSYEILQWQALHVHVQYQIKACMYIGAYKRREPTLQSTCIPIRAHTPLYIYICIHARDCVMYKSPLHTRFGTTIYIQMHDGYVIFELGASGSCVGKFQF